MPELMEAFKPYMGKAVALYGLGAATEKALPELREAFHIVGLLDSFTEEGSLYGLPILPFAQAAKQVDLVIVVARPGSCKAIVSRIGVACAEHNIALLDIRGKDLLAVGQPAYDFCNTTGGTKEELQQKLRQTEAISFDLFDTLITRRILLPTDIYDLVDMALRKRGIEIPDFSQKRLTCDMVLSKTGAPTLEEIYAQVIRLCNPAPAISAAELAELEWEIDCGTVLPRYAVCDLCRDLLRVGRQVCVISDTYYSAAQLRELLEMCGLSGIQHIFASCEYGVSKTQGLFERYQAAVPAGSYLHIGDNTAADIEAADRAHMDTFRLYSGLDLLNELGELSMGGYMDTLANRLKIGLFVSRLFNDPFQFETEDRHLAVSSSADIGYLFCAPLMSDFVLWFHEQVHKYDLHNLWFSARDGYLIQKMYQVLAPEQEGVYFLTSRTAAIRAGMENEADISYVDSMKFSGTAEDNLKIRFGLDACVCRKETLEGRSGLMQYQAAILEKAREYRGNYLRYISSLPLKDGSIAFFDFVARGTTQLYMRRLVERPMKGLYFLQMEPEFMPNNNLDIEPFYTPDEVAASAVFEDYYILETIVTAPHPSISHIDEAGHPVYTAETRTPEDLACVSRVQDGILEYFRDYLHIAPEECRRPNKMLDDIFLRLLHRVRITDNEFLSMGLDDPFLNRRSTMTELIS